jgi:guanylate kinase
MQGRLIIFSAPSGSGKTTIVKEILQSDIPFGFSVSATSRPPRQGETNGKDYNFFSVEEFKDKIAKEEFLEWEEVYPNQFYGTLKSDVERIRKQGQHVLFDVDVVGGLNIKKYYAQEALAIFVKAPNEESLRQRLTSRGTEDEASLQKRLEKASFELSFASKFDLIIINDKLEEAVKLCHQKIEEFILTK